MAPELMLCDVPKASLTDDFEDLLESMELDEGLLRELLEEVNDETMEQTSMMEAKGNDGQPVKENLHDASHVLSDHKFQLLFDQDKQIQDFDYWISQEMCCSFPGSPFESEMMPFWNLEDQIKEEEMVDDIAYVELWEGWKS